MEAKKRRVETYHRTCPFCKMQHEQRMWLNIICPCGGKYYFAQEFWLDRKTGERVIQDGAWKTVY